MYTDNSQVCVSISDLSSKLVSYILHPNGHRHLGNAQASQKDHGAVELLVIFPADSPPTPSQVSLESQS